MLKEDPDRVTLPLTTPTALQIKKTPKYVVSTCDCSTISNPFTVFKCNRVCAGDSALSVQWCWEKNNISTIFFPLSLPRACSTLADCTFSGVFPLIYPLNALTFSGTETAATCCSFSEKKKHITSPQCNAQGNKTHRRIQKRLGALLSDTSPRLFRPAEYRRRSILMLIICHRSGRWSDEQNEAKNEETTTASDTNTGGGGEACISYQDKPSSVRL